MGSHLDTTVKAWNKCLDDAKKIEKEYKAAKTPQEKDKLMKMAQACQKQAQLCIDATAAANAKEHQMLKEIIQNLSKD
jgi:hypothetical protein